MGSSQAGVPEPHGAGALLTANLALRPAQARSLPAVPPLSSRTPRACQRLPVSAVLRPSPCSSLPLLAVASLVSRQESKCWRREEGLCWTQPASLPAGLAALPLTDFLEGTPHPDPPHLHPGPDSAHKLPGDGR